MVMPAAEAGLQRGTLITQHRGEFRKSEIRNHTSDILFKNKDDQFRTGA